MNIFQVHTMNLFSELLITCFLINFVIDGHRNLTAGAVSTRFGYSAAEQRLWKRKHDVINCTLWVAEKIFKLNFYHSLQHCSGPHQSPIAIHSRRSIPSNIPAIEFIYYHNLLPATLSIHNNGHSVSLITPKPENFTQFPFIFGGKLRAEFEFVGLHFHWGDKNNRGSVSEPFCTLNKQSRKLRFVKTKPFFKIFLKFHISALPPIATGTRHERHSIPAWNAHDSQEPKIRHCQRGARAQRWIDCAGWVMVF